MAEANDKGEKRRKTILFIGTLAVAIMFISSYVSFGNGSASTSTSTVVQSQGYPVIGYVNSIILGYTNFSIVKLSGPAVNYSGAVSGVLSGMQANGSINNYVPLGNQFNVYTVRINPNGMQSVIYNALESSSTPPPANALAGINVSSTAKVSLPQYITLYFHNQPISIAAPGSNATLGLTDPPPLNSALRLKVFAVVSANGTIEDGQFNVSLSN
jgi:hypothetical protein